jgi:hypothetical protein
VVLTLGLSTTEPVIEQIRIFLSDLSPLVADLLDQAVTREPDMVIVGRAAADTDPIALRRLVVQHEPDVLVVAESRRDPAAEPSPLLAEFARMTVIAIDPVVGTASGYELRPHRFEIVGTIRFTRCRWQRRSSGPSRS